MEDHKKIFKWHRKWVQFLTGLSKVKLTAVAMGQYICQALMELYISTNKRVWAKEAGDWVRVGEAPLLYTPGRSSRRNTQRMPLATLRRFLLIGMSKSEALQLDVVTDKGSRPRMLPSTDSEAPGPSTTRRRRGRWRGGVAQARGGAI